MVKATDSVPMTPDLKTEKREASVGIGTPFTCILTPSSGVSTDSDGLGFCSTPKESVFDPFAPGSEELLFAPKKRDSEDAQCYRSRRRLDYGLGFDIGLEYDVEEADFSESFSESLIDEGFSYRNLMPEFGVGDGFKTPDSSPLLNGVDVTCPGAPKKRPREDAQFCRLDYGCDLDIGFEDDVDEADFSESFSESLIHDLVLKRDEGILMPEFGLGDGFNFKTPYSSPLRNRVAVICPSAPKRTSGKSRELIAVRSRCQRKLEF